jgi:Fur family transcriptional regulator, zinc uptake regulator
LAIHCTVSGHNHSAEALVLAAKAASERAGEQWTDMRDAVYRALVGHGRPMNAYHLADELGRHLGRKLAPNSVYRILHHFMTLKLVKRIESQNLYVPCHDPGANHDCIFMVCERCGDAQEVEEPRFMALVSSTVAQQGFSLNRPVVEMLGLCARCQSA